MNRLMKFLARLYPAAWRQRYEEEFDALIEDVKPGWRASFDILRGAAAMQLRTGSFWKVMVFSGVTGLAGLLIGLAVSAGMPKQYLSQSVIRMEPENADYIKQLARSVLSRPALTAIVHGYKLYPAEQAKMPLEDVVAEMKNDIQISRESVRLGQSQDKASAFTIRFLYKDPVIAQRVASELVSRFMASAARTSEAGVTLELMDAPKLGDPIRPNPTVIALIGLAAGLGSGISVALLRRSPKPA